MSKDSDPVKQNAALKAELQRLESLVQEIEEDEPDDEGFELPVYDEDDVKQAFSQYDADGSGYIDKAEFGVMAAALGEVLDSVELKEAFEMIDTSKDNRISYDEFLRWWKNEDRTHTEKSVAKINGLRAKLVASYLVHSIPKFVRALSETKTQKDDLITYRAILSVGDVPEPPRAHLHLDARFTQPDPAPFGKFPECGVLLQFDMMNIAGRTDAELEAGRARLEKYFQTHPKPETVAKVTVESKHCTRLSLGHIGADPLALARQLNIDLAQYFKNLSLKIDFANPMSDFLDADARIPGTLASMLKLKLDIDIQYKKSLAQAIGNSGVPNTKPVHFLALLEKANFALKLGDFEELVRALMPSEGRDFFAEVERQQQIQNNTVENLLGDQATPELMAAISEQHRQQLETMRLVRQPFTFLSRELLLRENFQGQFRDSFNQFVLSAISQAPNELGELLACLRDNFTELSAISVLTPSGFRAHADIKQLCIYSFLPKF